jgi:glycine betaine/proline transport system substrate-binding protein
MKHRWTYVWLGMLCLLVAFGVYSGTAGESTAKQNKKTITFADPQWDSIEVHNQIARFILEHGYGYNTQAVSGSTAATFTGFTQGNIDVTMEVWPNNYREAYDKAMKAGDIKVLGLNFKGQQGFFVPTYVIKGDPDKGIKPMAPGLKSVKDLPKYWKVFRDPEDPSKGRIVGGYSNGESHKITQQKVKTYGLDKTYNHFTPGTAGALAASFVKAYQNHDAWVGYYWTPTWLATKYDVTLLKEPPYNEKTWNKNYGTEFPPDKVTVAVYKDFPKKAPDAYKFLKQYHTSTDLTGEALVYMQDNDATAKEAAHWWLKKHEDLWSKWVPNDVAQKVKNALN